MTKLEYNTINMNSDMKNIRKYLCSAVSPMLSGLVSGSNCQNKDTQYLLCHSISSVGVFHFKLIEVLN